MARTRIQAFERVIDLAVSHLRPPEVQRVHARIAREGLAEHLAALPGKPPVRTIVDGRAGAAEESVRAYGLIRYEFGFLAEIAPFALEQARTLSPVDSGRYRDSWIVLADGVPVDAAAVPPETVELTIVNPEPYSRKLNVGKGLDGTPFVIEVPPNFVERVAQAVLRRWGNIVRAQVRYLSLQGAYTIKTGNAVLLRREAGRAGILVDSRAQFQSRRDRNAGSEVTYPAVVIRQR